ncbi:MAG: hypothetical protein OXT07_03755 [bacterium]|nr:hypothetical protein [bacterium]MDE0216910.1 hypothetical protein [bacterium]
MASAMPTKPSTTQWLPVSTTATAISSGEATAKTRTGIDRVDRNSTTQASTFHPTWKLGRAAYLFTIDGGWRNL